MSEKWKDDLAAIGATIDALRNQLAAAQERIRELQENGDRLKGIADEAASDLEAKLDAVRQPLLDRAIAAEARSEANARLLRDMVDLAEYWINREDRRDMSEADYNTWLSLGFRSSAMQRARAAIAEGKK